MKTLIVYTSKHGTTEKCARELKGELTTLGGDADLFELKGKAMPDEESYDSIVLGSPVYMGNIRKEMIRFLEKKSEAVKRKNVGLFLCSLREDETQEVFGRVFPRDLLGSVRIKASFGGAIS